MFRYRLTISEIKGADLPSGIYPSFPGSKPPEIVRHESYYDLSLAELQGIYSYVTLMRNADAMMSFMIGAHGIELSSVDEDVLMSSNSYYCPTKYPLSYDSSSCGNIPRTLEPLLYSNTLGVIWYRNSKSSVIELMSDNLASYLAGFLFADRLLTKFTSVHTFGLNGISGSSEPLLFSLADNFPLMELPSELIAEITKYYPCDWVSVSKDMNSYVTEIVLTDPRIKHRLNKIIGLIDDGIIRYTMVKRLVNGILSLNSITDLKHLAMYMKYGMEPLVSAVNRRVIELGDLDNFIQNLASAVYYKSFTVQRYSSYLDPNKITNAEIRRHMMICGIIPLDLDKLLLQELSDEDMITLSNTVLTDSSIDKLTYVTKVIDLLASPRDTTGVLPYLAHQVKSYREQHYRFTRWIINNINLFPDGPHINKVVVIFSNSSFIICDESLVRNSLQFITQSLYTSQQSLTMLEREILDNIAAGYSREFELEMLNLIRSSKLYKYVKPEPKRIEPGVLY